MAVAALLAAALAACGTQDPAGYGPAPGAPPGAPARTAPDSAVPTSTVAAPTSTPTSTPPGTGGGLPPGVPYRPPAGPDRSAPALVASAMAYLRAVNAHDLNGAVALTCPRYRNDVPGLPPDVDAGNMFGYTQVSGITWRFKDARLEPDQQHATVDYQGPRGADDVWTDDFEYQDGWCHVV